MSKQAENAREALDAVVQDLTPIFSKLGYQWVSGMEGTSSGGPFANGHFVGPAGCIGLIWRIGSGLGGVSYGPRPNEFQCSHEDVMRHLGVEADAHFFFDKTKWAPVARKGNSLISALAHDIELYSSQVLTAPPSILEWITRSSQERFFQELRELASNSRMHTDARKNGARG